LLPLRQLEWSFCQEPGCDKPDRVDDLPGRLGTQLWLRQFKGDPFQMRILRDLLSNQISLPPSREADDTVIEQIAELLISDRLHLHAKEMETHAAGGAEASDKFVAFPLSERQPRDTAPPPQVADPPTFSKGDPSAQAAALTAAAATGVPFCQECQDAAQKSATTT
jgi:hypothetical protein